MRYLVLRPKGAEMCTLQVLPDGTDVKHPFNSWAMRSGRQVIFIEKDMARLLNTYYLGGSYYDGAGAAYMTTFEEMQMILEEKIGPNDRRRAEMQSEMFSLERRRAREARHALYKHHAEVTTEVFAHVGLLALKILFLGLKFVAFVVLFPFVIMWAGRNDKK